MIDSCYLQSLLGGARRSSSRVPAASLRPPVQTRCRGPSPSAAPFLSVDPCPCPYGPCPPFLSPCPSPCSLVAARTALGLPSRALGRCLGFPCGRAREDRSGFRHSPR